MISEKQREEQKQKEMLTIVQRYNMHGFIIEKDLMEVNPVEARKRFDRENARMMKWKKMLPDLKALMMAGDETLKRRVRKGIPNTMRFEVWPTVCNLRGLKSESKFFYDDLILKENWLTEEEIKKDVIRTYQNNIFFMNSVGKVGHLQKRKQSQTFLRQ